MPRPAKPWWDSHKNQWACRHEGRYVPLGGDFEEAQKAFHRLKVESADRAPPGRSEHIQDVFDDYLRYLKANRSPATVALAEVCIRDFDRFVGDMLLSEFMPAHLQRWLDDQPKRIPYVDRKGEQAAREVHWSDNTKRGKARVIQQAFTWALRQGLIDRNPVQFFEKPRATRREGVLSDAQWKALLALYAKDDAFLDVLRFCRLTGARPFEVCIIEARHIAKDVRSLTLPRSEAKMKRRPRTIYLGDDAAAIVRRLLAIRKSGRLFRDSKMEPWNKNSIRCRLRRAKEKLGMDKLVLGMVRKTWETSALQSGIPLAVVAELAGHNPATALEYYSHLGEQTGAMKDAAQLAAKAQAASSRRKDHSRR